MRTYEKEHRFWPLSHDERLNIVYISATGRDLDDLLCNAEISVEDWNGNSINRTYTAGDLSDVDARILEREFTGFLEAV